jgi:hypothetical protein
MEISLLDFLIGFTLMNAMPHFLFGLLRVRFFSVFGFSSRENIAYGFLNVAIALVLFSIDYGISALMHQGIVIGALAMLLIYLVSGRFFYRLFQKENSTHRVMTYCLLFAGYQLLQQYGPMPLSLLGSLYIIGTMLLYPLWDLLFYSILVAVGTGKSAVQIAREDFGRMMWVSAIPIAMGALAAVVFKVQPWLVVRAVVPLFWRTTQCVRWLIGLTNANGHANSRSI